RRRPAVGVEDFQPVEALLRHAGAQRRVGLLLEDLALRALLGARDDDLLALVGLFSDRGRRYLLLRSSNFRSRRAAFCAFCRVSGLTRGLAITRSNSRSAAGLFIF